MSRDDVRPPPRPEALPTARAMPAALALLGVLGACGASGSVVRVENGEAKQGPEVSANGYQAAFAQALHREGSASASASDQRWLGCNAAAECADALAAVRDGRVGEARLEAARFVDRSVAWAPMTSDERLVARLAVDEAWMRGDGEAAFVRAVRGRIDVAEASARAALMGVASLAKERLLRAKELRSTSPALRFAVAAVLAELGDDRAPARALTGQPAKPWRASLAGAAEGPPLEDPAIPAAVAASFGETLFRFEHPEDGRRALAALSISSMVRGDDLVRTPLVRLVLREGAHEGVLDAEGRLEVAVRRRSAAELRGWQEALGTRRHEALLAAWRREGTVQAASFAGALRQAADVWEASAAAAGGAAASDAVVLMCRVHAARVMGDSEEQRRVAARLAAVAETDAEWEAVRAAGLSPRSSH